MADGSSSKRRKVERTHIKLLDEAKRSSVTRDGLDTLEGKDRELWIIRVPREVDVSSLSGEEIHLDDSDQRISCDERVYDMHTSTHNTASCAPTLLTPSSKPGKLKCGLEVKGEISLVQTVDIPEVHIPPGKTSQDKVTVPQGLKLRWKPFGWREPYHMDSEQLRTTAPHRKSSKHKQKEKKKKKLKRLA